MTKHLLVILKRLKWYIFSLSGHRHTYAAQWLCSCHLWDISYWHTNSIHLQPHARILLYTLPLNTNHSHRRIFTLFFTGMFLFWRFPQFSGLLVVFFCFEHYRLWKMSNQCIEICLSSWWANVKWCIALAIRQRKKTELWCNHSIFSVVASCQHTHAKS